MYREYKNIVGTCNSSGRLAAGICLGNSFAVRSSSRTEDIVDSAGRCTETARSMCAACNWCIHNMSVDSMWWCNSRSNYRMVGTWAQALP